MINNTSSLVTDDSATSEEAKKRQRQWPASRRRIIIRFENRERESSSISRRGKSIKATTIHIQTHVADTRCTDKSTFIFIHCSSTRYQLSQTRRHLLRVFINTYRLVVRKMLYSSSSSSKKAAATAIASVAAGGGAGGVLRLFDILKFLKQIETGPNFSTVLGLDYYHLTPSQTNWDMTTNTLTIELPNPYYNSHHHHFPSTLTHDNNHNNNNHHNFQNLSKGNQKQQQDQKITMPPTLSTLLAMVDETSTWALMLADPNRNRPGVSVSLKAQRGPTSLSTSLGGIEDWCYYCPTLQIINQVTKIGNTLGFCNAQVVDATSGTIICFASHIKYLPMGWFGDFILSSKGWPLAQLYTQYTPVKEQVSLSLDGILDTFQSSPPSSPPSYSSSSSHERVTPTPATFQSSSLHTNGVGTLHGGVQAMLLEQAVIEQFKEENNNNKSSSSTQLQYVVDSIAIEYLSAAKSKHLTIPIESIMKRCHHDEDQLFVAKVMSEERVCCQGELRVVRGIEKQ